MVPRLAGSRSVSLTLSILPFTSLFFLFYCSLLVLLLFFGRLRCGQILLHTRCAQTAGQRRCNRWLLFRRP